MSPIATFDDAVDPVADFTTEVPLTQRLITHFQEAIRVHQTAMMTLAEPLTQAAELLFAVLANNNKILACGNGGSAADAQHFAAEMVGRFEQFRLPLAAIALSTDTSLLTAIANDFGFDHVFAKQVQALGQPGDCLFAISTSGHSANVLAAIEAAHAREMSVVALTGKDGGAIGTMLQPGDVHLCVPDQRTARIQEIHLLSLHALCDAIDAQLLGDIA